MEANVFDINLLGMEKNMQLIVTGGSSGVGAEVEFIAYDMSGHGPSDLPNSMDYWQRAVEWIGFYFDRASEASIGVH